MFEPMVSVVIPTYKSLFLEEAIRSVLRQTYKRIEIIVSDNCPADDVRKVIQRYPRIRYVNNPIPGVYSNFRNAMRLASGDFVKFLLDDDLLAPRCIERMVQCFEKYENATLVAGWYYKIDAEGNKTDLKKFEEKKVIKVRGESLAKKMLISAQNLIGPLTTFMFRRNTLPLGLGPWFFHTGAPQLYFGLIDMAIILDIAYQGDVVLFPKPLSAMRFHDNQLSNIRQNPGAANSLKSWLPLAEDANAFGLISDRNLQTAYRSIQKMHRRWAGRIPELKEQIDLIESKLLPLNHSDIDGT